MKILVIFFLIFCFLAIVTTSSASSACINPTNGQQVTNCASTQNCFYNPPGDPTNASSSYSCESPDSPRSTLGQIIPPTQVINLGFGNIGISNLVNKFITFIFMGASIIFVFLVLISAVELLTSGGDKEKIEGARKRLTYAIIGISVLALSFVIINAIGQITGFQFITF